MLIPFAFPAVSSPEYVPSPAHTTVDGMTRSHSITKPTFSVPISTHKHRHSTTFSNLGFRIRCESKDVSSSDMELWSVDLKGLVEQNKHNFIPPTSCMTNYVVLKFGNHTNPTGTGGYISGSECIYMVVFQYGSIVLFNVREHEVDEYLKVVERHPDLNTWMQGGLDYIMLQFLNIDGVRTIGQLMLNFPDDVREHRLKEMAEKASGGGGGGVGEAEQEEKKET